MSKTIIYTLSTAIALFFLFSAIGLSANKFRILEIRIPTSNSVTLNSLSGYTFALVSDPHLKNEPRAWASWDKVIQRVNEANPDYVFLLGDYTGDVLDDASIEVFRKTFIESLNYFTTNPILVLGNHETWNDRHDWYAALKGSGIDVLENEAMLFDGDRALCVIGVGDSYTGYAEKKSYEKTCMSYPTLTITHDPAAAFDLQGSGLWFAGHTHCGQITLPMINPIWVPSTAPKQARCGLYENESKAVFVSSGIGNSILPIRFYAPSRVEIVKIM
jgi:uncharacterized protein